MLLIIDLSGSYLKPNGFSNDKAYETLKFELKTNTN